MSLDLNTQSVSSLISLAVSHVAFVAFSAFTFSSAVARPVLTADSISAYIVVLSKMSVKKSEYLSGISVPSVAI